MCIFSQPTTVSDTQIFARRAKDLQYLVYRMRFDARKDVAMILPLPTPEDAKEDTLKFIDMRGYLGFFKDLEEAFEAPPPPRGALAGGFGGPKKEARPPLKVTAVGGYEASFAPRLEDMDRLDERFRLPRDVWKSFPQYDSYGFAVFKLQPGVLQAPPLGMSFPTQFKTKVYFPTVHIHDGRVHDKELFDHTLFAQLSAEQAMYADGWSESTKLAGQTVNRRRAGKLVDPEQHLYRRKIRGLQKNEDTLV